MTRLALLLSPLLLLTIPGCKKEEPTVAPEPAAPAPAPEGPAAPPEAEPEPEPEAEKGPDKAELAAAQIRSGDGLYEQHCSSCHGENGEGKKGKFPAVFGDNALNLKPPKGAKKRKGEFESAQDVADFITEYMPPKTAGDLSEEEVYAIVAVLLRGNGVELDEPLTAETAPETAPQLPDEAEE